MKKLKIGDLERIRDKVRKTAALRQDKARAKVTVHKGTCGMAAGAGGVHAALLEEIEHAKITDVIVTTSGCAGLCSREPMITLEVAGQPPLKYVDLNPEVIKQILHDHIVNGNIVKKHAFAVGSERTY